MNSNISNSTISTMDTLNRSGSSKAMMRNSSRNKMITGVKAIRQAKFKVKGVGSSRWMAAVRRDSSLAKLQMGRKLSRNCVKSNQSLSSNLGRGLEALCLVNSHNADFNKDAPCGEIFCNIKSAYLQRVLHLDIDSEDSEEFDLGQDRWSAKSSGEKRSSALSKPLHRDTMRTGYENAKESSSSAHQSQDRWSATNSGEQRSSELFKPLHLDTDFHTVNDNAKESSSSSHQGQDRWSAKNSGEKRCSELFKAPTRYESNDHLC